MGRPGGPRSGITDISKGRARESRFADAPLRSREVTDINSERSPAYAKKVFNKEPVSTPTPERTRDAAVPGHQHKKLVAAYEARTERGERPDPRSGSTRQMVKGMNQQLKATDSGRPKQGIPDGYQSKPTLTRIK